MNSINYLKFDLRLTKDSMKYYILILMFFIAFMVFEKAYIFGLSYMFFILVLVAKVPFNFQGNEKSLQMYYMFPAKISSMVLGRFLYLISLEVIMFLVNSIIMIVLYKANELNSLQISAICLSGILSMIICFIQYPLYYKFETEKAKMVASIISLAPAFIIFTLPDYFAGNNQSILSYQDVDVNLVFPIIVFTILITILIGCISYLISYGICKRKEV